jgi:hypothetical protein
MKKLKIIFILFLGNYSLHAQLDTLGKSEYECKVKLRGRDIILSGDLYKAADTIILLKMVNNSSDYHSLKFFSLMSIPVSRIEKISFYTKGSGSKGFVTGGIIGFAVGGTLGFASNQAESSSDLGFHIDSGVATFGGGIVLMIPGMITGLIIGSETARINLNGDLNEYHKRMSGIKFFSIKH